MRELCAGVNVDLGTAAALREQWEREAGIAISRIATPVPLLLRTDQFLGDVVAMTAAVWSLHRSHPGEYTTAVDSRWPEVFTHNPDVVPVTSDSVEVRMHYPAIHRANQRGIHFMQGWCEFLGMALGTNVPLLTNRPHIYFMELQPPVEDFWLVCSGGKRDMTNKRWGCYQEVVYQLKGKVSFVQVGAEEDDHPRLNGAIDAVGKTSLRELFDYARRARGILCGVSLLMHLAAALEKPCVCIAGGREPVQWNTYPRQQLVHTVGALSCCRSGGCWKSRVVKLNDGAEQDKSLCENPTLDDEPVGKCMALIRPAEVTELVLRCNQL